MLTRIIRRDDSVSLRQYQNLNAENLLGTMQSIEHALRSLDKLAEHEQERRLRLGKTLADYQAQADKPFDHEAGMKDLLARQTKLNAALDLDKNETQLAPPAEDDIGLAGESPPQSVPLPKLQRASVPAMSP